MTSEELNTFQIRGVVAIDKVDSLLKETENYKRNIEQGVINK